MLGSEIQKAQELVYELKIGDIMSRQLITITPESSMREVKQLLRERRISGTPVMVGSELVGIVSIEDLIVAMEHGELDALARQYMTVQLYTAQQDESAVRALGKFAQTGVGRLPVLDAEGRLVGIVTPDDITRGVLKALQDAYHKEEQNRRPGGDFFDEVISDSTSLFLRYDVPAGDFQRAGGASSRLKQTLKRLGIEPQIVRRIAIVSYEAEMNIVIHSTGGGALLAELTPDRIAISAVDRGPGIPDISAALQPGFSTAPDWIREMGFGAGMGLCNIQACADRMELESSAPGGTRLTAVINITAGEGTAADETASDHGGAVT